MAIYDLTVHAGDFIDGTAWPKHFKLMSKKKWFLGEKIYHKEIEAIEIATEESVKKAGGTVGWGLAGAALLGPVGLLAGLLLGGKKKKITFVVTWKDGRRMFASCDSRMYTNIQAAIF